MKLLISADPNTLLENNAIPLSTNNMSPRDIRQMTDALCQAYRNKDVLLATTDIFVIAWFLMDGLICDIYIADGKKMINVAKTYDFSSYTDPYDIAHFILDNFIE